MDLYTSQECRDLDRSARDVAGISGDTLMTRAGTAAFKFLKKTWPKAKSILVVCGTGNNGGDGFVVARLAKKARLNVFICVVGDVEKVAREALKALQETKKAGIKIQEFSPEILNSCDVVVDAIFGIGLDRPVMGMAAHMIKSLNDGGKPILSLDVPSGLHSDTGQILGAAVRATHTITFIASKRGFMTGDGLDSCGFLQLDSLNIPQKVYASVSATAHLLNWHDVKTFLPTRPKNSHKGTYGHVLIVGGDKGTTGAAILAGRAALRAGSGLVSVATRLDHAAVMNVMQPELMCSSTEGVAQIAHKISQADVVAVGPGLGQLPWAKSMWGVVSASTKNLIVDADALGLLAQQPMHRDDWILTPHPGEASRLLGCTARDVQNDRFAAARELQKNFGGVIVLKGCGTIIDDGEHFFVCPYGNPGMASGGMGDSLTGVIASLVGQGLSLVEASQLGVCWHALSGDFAVKKRDGIEHGLLASDVIETLPDIFTLHVS